MTLVLKLDLDIVLSYHCAKKKVSIPSASKVTAQTDTQTDRHTDRWTDRQTQIDTDRQTDRQTDTHTHTHAKNITSPHTRAVIIPIHLNQMVNYGYVTPCFTLGG